MTQEYEYGYTPPRTSSATTAGVPGNPFTPGTAAWSMWNEDNAPKTPAIKGYFNGEPYYYSDVTSAGTVYQRADGSLIGIDPKPSSGGSIPQLSLNISTPGTTSSRFNRVMDDGSVWLFDELEPSFAVMISPPVEQAPKSRVSIVGNQIVDYTDPRNPIVTAIPGGGDGGSYSIREVNGVLSYVPTAPGGEIIPIEKQVSPTLYPASGGGGGGGSASSLASALSRLSSGGGGGIAAGNAAASNAQEYALKLGYEQQKNRIDMEYEQKLLEMRNNLPMSAADRQMLEWREREAALDRAQQLAIEGMRNGIDQARLDLERVTAFRESMQSTDPGAVAAFLKAYGTIGAGLAQGGTALSDAALLPSAQLLSQMQSGYSVPPGVPQPPPASGGTLSAPAGTAGNTIQLPNGSTTTVPPFTGSGAAAQAAGQSVTLPNGQVVPLDASGNIDYAKLLGIAVEPVNFVNPETERQKAITAWTQNLRAAFEEAYPQFKGGNVAMPKPGETTADMQARRAAYNDAWTLFQAQTSGDLTAGLSTYRGQYTGQFKPGWEGFYQDLLPSGPELDPLSFNVDPASNVAFFQNQMGSVSAVPYTMTNGRRALNWGQAWEYKPTQPNAGRAPDYNTITGAGALGVPTPVTTGTTITGGAGIPYGNDNPQFESTFYGTGLDAVPPPVQARANGGPVNLNAGPVLVGEPKPDGSANPEIIMGTGIPGQAQVIPLAGSMADGGTLNFDQWVAQQGYTPWAGMPGVYYNGVQHMDTASLQQQYQQYLTTLPPPTPPPPVPTISASAPASPAIAATAPPPPPAPIHTPVAAPTTSPGTLPPVTQPAPASQTSSAQVTIPPSLAPVVADIRQQRESTPFEFISPYLQDYERQNPVALALSEQGLQSARGIPTLMTQWEQQRFRLPGTRAAAINLGI